MKQNTKRRLLIYIAASIVFLALCVMVGSYVGSRSAQADIERIEILWPNWRAMSSEDRLLLAEVSMKWPLRDVPKDADAVKLCLKAGASLLQADKPNTFAVSRMEILLKSARG